MTLPSNSLEEHCSDSFCCGGKNRSKLCFICKHELDEHADVHRPFGQSGKACFHGKCDCNSYESMYNLDGSKRKSLFS